MRRRCGSPGRKASCAPGSAPDAPLRACGPQSMCCSWCSPCSDCRETKTRSGEPPATEPDIDLILNLGDQDAERREHDQHREDLLGFQHLSGEIEPRAEAELADAHLAPHDQDDGYPEPEPHAGED